LNTLQFQALPKQLAHLQIFPVVGSRQQAVGLWKYTAGSKQQTEGASSK
jgi:hypothetical protein